MESLGSLVCRKNLRRCWKGFLVLPDKYLDCCSCMWLNSLKPVRTRIFLLLLTASLSTTSISRAWITDITYQSASTNNLYCWGPVNYSADNMAGTLNMGGYQFGAATVSGTITTSSSEDPSFTM